MASEDLDDPVEAGWRPHTNGSRAPRIVERDRARGRAPGRRSSCPAIRSSSSSASAHATGCTSTRPAAAPARRRPRATPGRTARRTCSSSAASRRATTRRSRGCWARGWAAWIETEGHGVRLDLGDEAVSHPPRPGPLRVHLFTHPTLFGAPARLPAAHRASPRCCPSGRTGTGRAVTSTTTRARPTTTSTATAEHGIPLDAIVLDSPWATQYNTWEFNPHQFPDAAG